MLNDSALPDDPLIPSSALLLQPSFGIQDHGLNHTKLSDFTVASIVETWIKPTAPPQGPTEVVARCSRRMVELTVGPMAMAIGLQNKIGRSATLGHANSSLTKCIALQ